MNVARAVLRGLVLPLLCGAAGAVIAADPEDLVIAQSENLPILITVPHGGPAGIPGVPLRRRGVTATDARTFEFAEAIAKHLEDALGARPYMVAARFSRKYIDANRPEAEALEAPDAKPAYDAYHSRIRMFISQIRARYPQGALLLDIHGQAGNPDTLHRGTKNGATVAELLKRHGAAALIGPNSIFGVVQRKGYKVFPPSTPLGDPPEDRRYDGGFTVRTYGSSAADGIDAIQLEVGRDLRSDTGFIAALGDAIAVFCKTYLPDSKSP